MSLFPQFTNPANGSILVQNLTLGATQMMISGAVNALIVLGASRVALWFQQHPTWSRVQRYVMGTILGGLAVRLALSERR